MTPNQFAVLAYLCEKQPQFVAPTEIGREVGGNGRHSAWASPICKRLVDLGLVNRSPDGHYKINEVGIDTVLA